MLHTRLVPDNSYQGAMREVQIPNLNDNQTENLTKLFTLQRPIVTTDEAYTLHQTGLELRSSRNWSCYLTIGGLLGTPVLAFGVYAWLSRFNMNPKALKVLSPILGSLPTWQPASKWCRRHKAIGTNQEAIRQKIKEKFESLQPNRQLNQARIDLIASECQRYAPITSSEVQTWLVGDKP